ncbi:hypothetical protein K8I61_06010 [bacterium]|nr:hypothetical protein [bacterium]
MHMKSIVLACIALLMFGTFAFAGDFETSPRFLSLADTGNAIFNPNYQMPVFENIAAAVDRTQYYVGGESRTNALFGVGSENDVDYSMLDAHAMAGVKASFPLNQVKDENDWFQRVAIVFQPGVDVELLRTRIDDPDTALELTDARVKGGPAIKLGAAYGFHKIFAAGLGFTMYPTSVQYNNFTGTQDTPNGNDNVEFQDNWTAAAPFAITPEVGFLWRTPDRMQFGLTYDMGYFAKSQRDIEHKTADGNIDYETETVVFKPHHFGLGWAYEIPQVEKFYVAADIDVYFSQSYEGDTYDPRRGQTFYSRNTSPSKDDPTAGKDDPRDPNRDNLGNKFYASVASGYVVSASVEKTWQQIALAGGMGYAFEQGLDKDRPASTFFMTAGPRLFFDDTIFLAWGGRFDIGFASAETTYLLTGGGTSMSLGGTF